MRKVWLILGISMLIVALGLGAYYLFVRNEPAQAPASGQPPSQGQQTPNTQTPTEQSTTYPVSVYFSKHPDSDDDPGKTFAVGRTSPDLGVARFSVVELLKGPSASERSQGYFSYVRLRDDVSNCGGSDFTLTLANSVATLQFCKTFDHIGSVSDGQAESSIKATLLQFPTITKAIILNKAGDCEFNLSGMNLCKQ